MLKNYFTYLYSQTVKRSGSAVYSLLENNKNAILLDCGCWDGANTKKFGDIIGTYFLYGMEINKAEAKEASKKDIKVKIADLNKKFPYEDNFFDVIIAYHVIEHLINVKLFVSEMYRVLKNDGYVVIGTPNLASWHNIFALFLGLQPFSGPTIKQNYKSNIKLVKEINKERFDRVFLGHESIYLDHIKIMTVKALIGLLEDNKFHIDQINGFGYYPLPPSLSNIVEKLDPYHSHYVIVKARKKSM